MKKIGTYFTALVLGLCAGGGSALWVPGLIGGKTLASFADINVNGWTSDWSIGAPSADPYLRARIAKHGLLALSKQEAVYFTRSRDDNGDRLTEMCRYALYGQGQSARWWSITLYDGQSRLPMNEDEALSIDATTIGGAAVWTAIIAPERPTETAHWISSRNAQQFDLTLRVYLPTQNVLDAPERFINPPGIKKLDCRDGSDA